MVHRENTREHSHLTADLSSNTCNYVISQVSLIERDNPTCKQDQRQVLRFHFLLKPISLGTRFSKRTDNFSLCAFPIRQPGPVKRFLPIPAANHDLPPTTTCRQPRPAANHDLPPTTTCRQPRPAANHDLPPTTTCRQPRPAANHDLPPTTTCRQPRPAANHDLPPTTTCRQPRPAANHDLPPTTTCRQPTFSSGFLRNPMLPFFS